MIDEPRKQGSEPCAYCKEHREAESQKVHTEADNGYDRHRGIGNKALKEEKRAKGKAVSDKHKHHKVHHKKAGGVGDSDSHLAEAVDLKGLTARSEGCYAIEEMLRHSDIIRGQITYVMSACTGKDAK